MDTGLLVARVVLGLLMAAHGAQKLLGWFGGYGLDGTAAFLEQLGFRPGRPFATAAALTEVLGGLLVAAGLFGPVGPALVLSVMIVAAISVHWQHGLFAIKNGIEVPLLYRDRRGRARADRPRPILSRRRAWNQQSVDADARVGGARNRRRGRSVEPGGPEPHHAPRGCMKSDSNRQRTNDQ